MNRSIIMKLAVCIEITISTRYVRVSGYVRPMIWFISDFRYRSMNMPMNVSVIKF